MSVIELTPHLASEYSDQQNGDDDDDALDGDGGSSDKDICSDSDLVHKRMDDKEQSERKRSYSLSPRKLQVPELKTTQ